LLNKSRIGCGRGGGRGSGAEDDIAIAGVRFKLAVELNIYSELTEKVRILLRI